MSLISDLKQLWEGSYLTVQGVANSFETNEAEARDRLDRLVDEENVLRRLPIGDRYAPAEHLEGREGVEEMEEKFNQEFADLREDIDFGYLSG